jgi:DNA polymerase-3 subunit gamma/tau
MSAAKAEKVPPAPPSGGRVDFTSRYRPQTIEELVGAKLRQEVLNLLKFGIGKVLLSGPYGYGKSSVARLLAKSLVCLSPRPGPCGACEACASFEVQWDKGGGWIKTREGIPRRFLTLDMTEKGKDDVQVLRGEIAPSFGASPPIFDTAVIVLDEIHRLARPAQELLLKPLESLDCRPVIACIADANMERLDEALRQRFTGFRISRPSDAEALAWAKGIAKREGIKIESAGALDRFVKARERTPRRLLSGLQEALIRGSLDEGG